MNNNNNNPVYPKQIVTTEIILRVWQTDYGVPSVDPDSLILMTLLKLYKVNATINYSHFPLIYDIPSIRYNNVVIPKGPKLLPYVKDTICREFVKLPMDELEKLTLYKKYFMDGFVQTFMYDCWLNDSNYGYAIETWFTNVIPSPFGHKYVSKMRKQVQRRFTNMLHERNPDRFMLECYETAELCLSDFSTMLNNKKYFYRNVPTSLDATIYSYLTIAMHMPLQKPHMQKMLKRYPRLTRYVKFMTKKYFPNTSYKFKYVEPVCPEFKPVSSDHIIQATVVVGSIMILYANTIGLINIKALSFMKKLNIVDILVESNFADYLLELALMPFSFYLS